MTDHAEDVRASSTKTVLQALRARCRIWCLLFVMGVGLVLLIPHPSLAIFGFFQGSTGKEEETPPPIPPEYKGKHLPSGWATDPKVIEAGKAIYEGTANPTVKCVECHGVDGHPTRMGRGAPDFSDPAEAKEPDDLWFWRISKGVRRTKMRGFEQHLTEEQRWQVIAYVRTFAQSAK